MDHIINLRELREHVETYAKRVKKGDSFLVMRRSTPLFRLTPPNEETGLETVVDFTDVRKGGISASELLTKLKSL